MTLRVQMVQLVGGGKQNEQHPVMQGSATQFD